MVKRVMSNWKTTSIGVVALIGLGINIYNNGLSVSDFLILVIGVGFIVAKDKKKSNDIVPSTVDPDKEYPNGKG